MTSFAADDALTFLEDWDTPVVLGGVSSFGILSRREVLENDHAGGQVQVTRECVRVATAVFPVIAVDAAITIDGVAYQVRYPELVPPDDVFTDVWVVKVSR
jgi:hypothetical protein